MAPVSALKPIRGARAWLALWLLACAAVVVVCLLPERDLPPVAPGADKVEHALAFFLLMASAVQLFAGGRALLRAAAGLVLLGVAIELAQAAFTADRHADSSDALADAAGVLLGLAIARTPLRDLLLRWQPG
ncbi:MAG: VanZ family protein [Pseudoxanthomonas sp.]